MIMKKSFWKPDINDIENWDKEFTRECIAGLLGILLGLIAIAVYVHIKGW